MEMNTKDLIKYAAYAVGAYLVWVYVLQPMLNSGTGTTAATAPVDTIVATAPASASAPAPVAIMAPAPTQVAAPSAPMSTLPIPGYSSPITQPAILRTPPYTATPQLLSSGIGSLKRS